MYQKFNINQEKDRNNIKRKLDMNSTPSDSLVMHQDIMASVPHVGSESHKSSASHAETLR